MSQPKSLPKADSNEQEIFDPRIEDASFEREGQETYYLHVRGKAPIQLEGGNLNIGLFYFGNNVGWVTTPTLRRETDFDKAINYRVTFYNFSQKNKLSLSGPYEVYVYFIPTQQPPSLEQKFNKIIEQKRFTPDVKTAYLRDEKQFEIESQWLNKFYAERIVIARILLNQLLEKARLGINVGYDQNPNNPFAKSSEADTWPRKLDVKKWEAWLKGEWEGILKEEEKKTKDHQERFVALRYPEVVSNLILIYILFRKYAQLQTALVYNVNSIPNPDWQDSNNRNMPIRVGDQYNSIERAFETIKRSQFFPIIAKTLDQVSDAQYQRLGYKRERDIYIPSKDTEKGEE